MTIEDRIHEWMNENAFNYVSPLDNTLDEDLFYQDVAKHFGYHSSKFSELNNIFWVWEGWEG